MMFDVNGIGYKHVQHKETFTSEESAAARGEAIEIGAKAIILKADNTFMVFVVSASKKIDSKKVKEICKAKKTRFATKDELYELTGLVPGSVPPFGRPLFDLLLYVDSSVFENKKVAFNAGSLTNSFILKTDNYREVIRGNYQEVDCT